MTGERSAAAPRRGRIRSRLRVGPVDIVVALDLFITVVAFVIDQDVPQTPSLPDGARPSGLILVVVSLITAAPLVLRGRRPSGPPPAHLAAGARRAGGPALGRDRRAGGTPADRP